MDAKGRQRPLTILDDHVEPVEGIGDGSIRGESGQVESPDKAGILCVVSDPLDGVFRTYHAVLSGFCMSLVAEVSAATFLSRVPSSLKMLASTLRRMYMGPVHRKWSVRNMPLSKVPLSTSWPQSSETH